MYILDLGPNLCIPNKFLFWATGQDLSWSQTLTRVYIISRKQHNRRTASFAYVFKICHLLVILSFVDSSLEFETILQLWMKEYYYKITPREMVCHSCKYFILVELLFRLGILYQFVKRRLESYQNNSINMLQICDVC